MEKLYLVLFSKGQGIQAINELPWKIIFLLIETTQQEF